MYIYCLWWSILYIRKVWINKSLASFSGSSCWLLAFVFTVSNQNWRRRRPGNKASNTPCFTLAFLNSHDATSSCYSYVNTLTEWHCPPSLVVSTNSLVSNGLASYSGRSLSTRLPWSLNASCVTSSFITFFSAGSSDLFATSPEEGICSLPNQHHKGSWWELSYIYIQLATLSPLPILFLSYSPFSLPLSYIPSSLPLSYRPSPFSPSYLPSSLYLLPSFLFSLSPSLFFLPASLLLAAGSSTKT